LVRVVLKKGVNVLDYDYDYMITGLNFLFVSVHFLNYFNKANANFE